MFQWLPELSYSRLCAKEILKYQIFGKTVKPIRKYIPELLIAVYVVLFVFTNQPSSPWDRMIASDGKGYYAYLPAFFIHGGDTDFSFIEVYEATYYPPGGELFKDFRFDTGNGIVNKYFPGPAVLWLPFFLVAHVITIVSGFPVDGYSMPYQLAIAFAAFFYFWLALLLTRKVLRYYTPNENMIAWVLIAVALATNLIYYTVNAPSQVHVYNFFLLSAFVFSVLAFCRSFKWKYLPLAALSLGMIIISRPQNGIVVFSIPFLCGDIAQTKDFFRRIFSNTKYLLFSLLLFVLPLLIPVLFWLLTTGKTLLYTYGSESYNLFKPHLLLFLFSFEKGWMLYTPIAAFAAFGFVYLFRNNKWKFFTLGAFLLFVVYFLSSWWIWNYTSYISQRVMIDFYIFLAILLVFVSLWVESKNLLKLLPVMIVFFVLLNVFQYFQQIKWIYPAGPVTASAYFRNFFSLTKDNTYFIPLEEIRDSKVFELKPGNMADSFVVDSSFNCAKDKAHPDCLFFLSDAAEKPVFIKNLEGLSDTVSHLVRFGALFNCNSVDSSLILNISFGKIGEIYSVNRRDLASVAQAQKWVNIETTLYIPYLRSNSDSVFISLGNNTGDTVFLENIKVGFVEMKNSVKYDWIPLAADDVYAAKVFKNDFEAELNQPWGNRTSVNEIKSLSGKRSSMLNAQMPYSVSFETNLDTALMALDGYLKVKSDVVLESDAKLSLVLDFSSNGKTVFYKNYPVQPASSKLGWFNFEMLRELPIKRLKADKLKVYFWYQSGSKNAYIDNLEIELVDYKKLKPVFAQNSQDNNTKNIATITQCEDFDKSTPLATGFIQSSMFAHTRPNVCECDFLHPYSFSHRLPLNVNSEPNQTLHVQAEVMSDSYKTNAVLVVDFQLDGKSVSYSPIYLNGTTRKGEWVHINQFIKRPSNAAKADSVLVYIYSPSKDEVILIDDFCVQLTHSK